MSMNKSTFLGAQRPLLVSMLQARTPERVEELMARSRERGAEAFGMQFEQLELAYHNEQTYRRLFSASAPLPVYVTNYRGGLNKHEKSDETLAEELLVLAECGAKLCDVMGDYFDHCEGELTMNEEAVKKQMNLIDELHTRGAEVLMSSHVLKYTPAERVLEIAMEHQRRGADICKIVTRANNMAEQIENLRITNLLKERLSIPFLFLSGGVCYFSRRVGGTLGNCMTLCVCEHDELSTKGQPLLHEMKAIRDYLEEKTYEI